MTYIVSRGAWNCTNSTQLNLTQLRTNFGERAFSHAGPAAWNSKPEHIRTEPDILVFSMWLLECTHVQHVMRTIKSMLRMMMIETLGDLNLGYFFTRCWRLLGWKIRQLWQVRRVAIFVYDLARPGFHLSRRRETRRRSGAVWRGRAQGSGARARKNVIFTLIYRVEVKTNLSRFIAKKLYSP